LIACAAINIIYRIATKSFRQVMDFAVLRVLQREQLIPIPPASGRNRAGITRM
jgi:hypothetical protein